MEIGPRKEPTTSNRSFTHLVKCKRQAVSFTFRMTETEKMLQCMSENLGRAVMNVKYGRYVVTVKAAR